MAYCGETLEFSLKLASIPIVLETEAGVKTSYTLREMNGEDTDVWHDFVRESLDMTPDMSEQDEHGKAKFKVKMGANFKTTGMQAKLISMCLFNSDNAAISQEEVQKFPTKVREALFDKAQEMNGLTEEVKEELKND